MTVLEQGNITIHTENIFPIIKKSLYSDREIFLRELVSNALDAINKLKMVSLAGEYQGEAGEPKIEIAVDKDAKTLSVSDNGIGMTAEEIKKYINQVAFSSAEEFIKKYQTGTDQQIIGHFGLGFYSSFMVAKKVEIDTLSYQEGSEPVHWSCDGSPSFVLEASERTTIGTTITLHLQDEETEYLEASRIKQLVKTYCDFMPVPIELDGEQANRQKAIWRESPSNLKDEDYLDFYRLGTSQHRLSLFAQRHSLFPPAQARCGLYQKPDQAFLQSSLRHRPLRGNYSQVFATHARSDR